MSDVALIVAVGVAFAALLPAVVRDVRGPRQRRRLRAAGHETTAATPSTDA